MASAEQFGMNQRDFAELERTARDIVVPAVDRNFGDDSDAEFNAGTEVALPTKKAILPGETALHAHIRLQAQQGGTSD